ncbi:S8 family peptidase [Methanosarcina horonobensis]|uniref:S8 family peptidase n=1 Tax=Methanosarcina horonobensis TaxID=418008 RepID=UPI000AFA5B13|nr:S8 family peptidase [Methanosarcina horonobensis]
MSAQADSIPWGVSNIKAPMCWEATMGKGIHVAVLDTGIWPHEDLKGNLLGGISFVPGESWVDENGHGTHVAGTIAAKLNGSGVVGVAPSAYLYGIKVLGNDGSGNWSWLMSGLYWMRKYHGCTFDIANLSLGGSGAPSALETYINYASEQTLLVTAAGNYPADAPDKPVMYPAKYERCLAVSAIQSDNTIAKFSGRGPEVELCAPGVNIVSTLPGNNYGSLSGTSMAAPHVAGAAALCRGTHRSLKMDKIREILVNTANNLGVPGKDDEYGYGKVDCNGATFHKSCG